MSRWKTALKTALMMSQLNSIEIFLAILCLIGGIPILSDPESFAPRVVLMALPLWVVYFWGGALTVGSLLNLHGLLKPAIHFRRAGLILLSSGSFVFGVAIAWGSKGFFPLLPFLTYMLFSWATLARYFVLGKYLRHAKKLIKD